MAFNSVVVIDWLLPSEVDEGELPFADDVNECAVALAVSPPTLAVIELEVVKDASVTVADGAVGAEAVGNRPGVRGSVSSIDRSDC